MRLQADMQKRYFVLPTYPLRVLLEEWYEDDILWFWEALYDREIDPRVVEWVVLGVLGTPFVAVRVVRAVSGVGALIKDFLGVSVTCLVLLPLKLDDEGVDRVLDVTLASLRFPAIMKGCRMAVCGFIRRSGSQTRHLAMKSTNSSSLHLRACARVLEPGLRRRPLEFVTGLGVPLVSKKSFFRELRLTNSFSGTPRTSIMQDNCSCSFSPGKIG